MYVFNPIEHTHDNYVNLSGQQTGANKVQVYIAKQSQLETIFTQTVAQLLVSLLKSVPLGL